MRVLATAGHVDHGKSTLVLALTGTDPDRLTEEKQRGLTIDLGFAHTELPSGAAISFVDVPGHSRFLANMLAGVGAVDAAVFVVSATDGWMPQSEEHLRIMELFGVEHGIVVLTKRDAVDDDLAELARLDVGARVAGTFLEGAPIVEVSAHTGAGMDALRAALDELVASTPPAADRGRPRLWIDRSFAAKGSGTVVTGTLTGGEFSIDDTVVIEPGGARARIRSIQTAGTTVVSVGPGHRVALNLNGVSHTELGRGDVVVEPDRWHNTSRFDGSLSVLDALDHPVSRRGAYVAYVGSRELPVRMRILGGSSLEPGTSGAARLFLPVALPLLPGDRFVLRESGRGETIGGGEILDIDPVLRASIAAPDRSVERVIRERGWVDVDVLERLTGVHQPASVGRWAATPEAVEAAETRLRELITGSESGVDLGGLAEHERALVEAADWATIEAGRARVAGASDPFADHPLAEAVRAGGFMPDLPAEHDRDAKRELVRRGTLVESEGVVFHRDAVDAAARLAAELLVERPDGFAVAELRDASGTSRKFALALAAELDRRGITRRRGDLRIGGPRLPT